MDGFDPRNHSPVTALNGLSLLQQVRGRYLTIHYDVEGLLSRYVKLLEQLKVTSGQIKTCKVSLNINMDHICRVCGPNALFR